MRFESLDLYVYVCLFMMCLGGEPRAAGCCNVFLIFLFALYVLKRSAQRAQSVHVRFVSRFVCRFHLRFTLKSMAFIVSLFICILGGRTLFQKVKKYKKSYRFLQHLEAYYKLKPSINQKNDARTAQ